MIARIIDKLLILFYLKNRIPPLKSLGYPVKLIKSRNFANQNRVSFLQPATHHLLSHVDLLAGMFTFIGVTS